MPFPPLAHVFRYGNVRGTDQSLVRRAIDGVLPRIIVGLGGAGASLNDDATRQMQHRIVRVHESVLLLDSPSETDDYLNCLAKIADQSTAHGLLRGRSTRLLFDHSKFASGMRSIEVLGDAIEEAQRARHLKKCAVQWPSGTDALHLFQIRIRESDLRKLRADLVASGIAYKDTSGRQFDFHSLRGQYILSVGNLLRFSAPVCMPPLT